MMSGPGFSNTVFSFAASDRELRQDPLESERFSTAGHGDQSTAMSSTATTAAASSSSSTVGIIRGRQLQSHPSPVQRNETQSQTKSQNTTGFLNQLLLLDEVITRSIGFYGQPKTLLQRVVCVCCKILEVSGHGVPWFLLCTLLLALYAYDGSVVYFDYGVNMFVLLLLDIVAVAPVKVLVKRPRPSLNIGPIPLSVSKVDNYAFPSGHTSRCVALAAYFCYMPPFNPWTHLWYVWGLLVSLSRVALGRHHVLDVGAGVVAGLLIFEVIRRSGILYGA